MILPVLASALVAAESHFFETQVRPLLAAKCYSCHTASQMGGLRLDSRDGLTQGGARGAAIVPGDPEASLLVTAVKRIRDDLKMPPSEALSAAEVSILTEWIEAGAEWPEAAPVTAGPPAVSQTVIPSEARNFWSFKRVRRPEIPAGESQAGPIDSFLLARLQRERLETAPEADKRTLIRRVTLNLLGLPPTPEEVDAFLADPSPNAYSKVVDRLLASPHYGERQARRWLDLARYADGRAGARTDDPLTNAWRYRDWVVQAFNDDLPYDEFITQQIAADLLPGDPNEQRLAALGFHALRDRDDDRVDVTSRVFLGLTVGCAQCHDHKFDPIPQSDFYSLQGVFQSSEPYEHPLAPPEQVAAFEAANKKVADQKLSIDRFVEKQRDQLIDVFMERTADYLAATWDVQNSSTVSDAAAQAGLDAETLERWRTYLKTPQRDHPYLDDWHRLTGGTATAEEIRRAAEAFQETLFAIHLEKRALDDRNYVKLGGADGVRDQRTLLKTNLEFLDPVKYYLWRDLAVAPRKKQGVDYAGGVYYYGPQEIDRFLGGVWRQHLKREQAQLKRLKAQVPSAYPFIHAYRDAKKPKAVKIAIRGDKKNLGEVAPRRFLAILSDAEPQRFKQGSGRLELARAIASPENPLTARVLVNRLWQWRFGRGLVGSPSNFGQMGERPSHPELLDWLAAELVEGGWSIKALDRRILLSDAYRRGSKILAANQEQDAENKLLWRFNAVDRLDAESLRDSILAVSGRLDSRIGGPAEPLTQKNHRRALYGTVARTSPDRTMTLFDFPDPKSHAEQRGATIGPLQRLYFLNNSFVIAQSKALAERLEHEAGDDLDARVRYAYRLLYARRPDTSETERALGFVSTEGWARYAQMLLASSEFFSVR